MVIKNGDEYQRSVQLVDKAERTMVLQQESMAKLGLNEEEIKTAMEPIAGFLSQVKEEIDAYKEKN